MTWDSILARPEACPRGWFCVDSDDVYLKDTRGGFYENCIPDPQTYEYELPARPKPHEFAVVSLIREQPKLAPAQRATFRVFATKHATNHFCGDYEFDALSVRNGRHFLTLRRASPQDARFAARVALETGREMRGVEPQHLEVLREAFEEWKIGHENAVCVKLVAPLVVAGKFSDFAGSNYTCDFVLAHPRGCARVCVESKACMERLDECARLKCRAIRDQALCRVVAMVGLGDDLRWVDFGPPGCASEREFACVGELKMALGLGRRKRARD